MCKNKFNDKGERHGYWETTYPHTDLTIMGKYVNGFKEGIWKGYWGYHSLDPRLFYIRVFKNNNFNYSEEYYNGLIDKKLYYI